MNKTGFFTLLMALCVFVSGCASLGDTTAEKRAAVIDMRDRTLQRLYEEKPYAKEQIANAAGYGVFDSASQNLIFLQTEGGYGVLTSAGGAVTYMRTGGAGVGLGLGLKDYQEVIIFKHQNDFERFRDSGWDATGSAEASLKSQDRGGALAGSKSVDLDVVTYHLIDSGAALQATVGAARYWKWKELN